MREIFWNNDEVNAFINMIKDFSDDTVIMICPDCDRLVPEKVESSGGVRMTNE